MIAKNNREPQDKGIMFRMQDGEVKMTPVGKVITAAALGLLAVGVNSRLDADDVFNPITQAQHFGSAVQGLDRDAWSDAQSMRAELLSDGENTSAAEIQVYEDGTGNHSVTYPDSDQGFNYIVQSGDSPYGIADRLSTTPAEHAQILDEVQKEMGPDGLQPQEQLHLGDKPEK